MADPTAPVLTPEELAENKGPRIMTVISIMTAVATFFVAGRIYSRLVSISKLGSDDYLVIFSIVLGWAYVGLAAEAIEAGGGRHIGALSMEQVERAIFMTVVSFVPGVLSFTIPKFAVVILLAKLLNPGRAHKVIMWIVSVLYLLIVAGMLTINFAQCTPAKGQWTPSMLASGEATCIDRAITVNYALMLGIYSAVLDFYLALYPTWVLLHLQMNWKKKLALSSSLGFGYCAGAVTIYKCTTLPGLLHLQDFTFAVDDVVLWTNIEANCVLIGACIPCMAPLVKKLFGGNFLGGSTPVYSGGAKASSGATPAKGSKGISSFRVHVRTQKSMTDSLGTESRDIILEERQSGSGYSAQQPGIYKKEEVSVEYEPRTKESERW